MLEAIAQVPLSAWRRIELTGIARAYRTPKILDETITLPGYYAGNNVANSRLKWGLRIARACLRGGGAGRAQASIALVVDVALGVDGESR